MVRALTARTNVTRRDNRHHTKPITTLKMKIQIETFVLIKRDNYII